MAKKTNDLEPVLTPAEAPKAETEKAKTVRADQQRIAAIRAKAGELKLLPKELVDFAIVRGYSVEKAEEAFRSWVDNEGWTAPTGEQFGEPKREPKP